MMLIPRFYYIVDKDNHSFVVDKRRNNKKRYIIDTSSPSQRFFVYYDKSYNGKFININDTYYVGGFNFSNAFCQSSSVISVNSFV